MRILIVDDRPLGARKLRDDILTAESDYQVEMAVSDGVTSAAERARQIVREARERFDIFLIDDSMGAGPNGTELMAELRRLSPSSEAIIFTAYGDEAGKQRAIEAGARAYITRPVNERELLWQLHGVQRDQDTRRERDWLQLLADTTRELQAANAIQNAGQAIVKGAQQLKFQRARLRMVCEGQGEQIKLIGVSQVGTVGLSDDYQTIRRSLSDLPYSRKVLLETRKPTLFHARELGEAPWDEFIGAPKDDWFKVPLFVGDTPIGTLSLDNGAEPIRYTGNDRQQLEQLLDLFGKQAAAALERARLQEQTEILSDIGRVATIKAAQGDLDALLTEVRQQVARLMNVDNFMAVLVDPDSSLLDFRLNYEGGQQLPRQWRDPECGLVGYLIRENRPLWFPDGEEAEFRRQHKVPDCGIMSQCWLGVPLPGDSDIPIGALVVQHYENPQQYDSNHQRLLEAIARLIAGAVDLVGRREREAAKNRRSEFLSKIVQRLSDLLQRNEEWFWHLLLKFLTDECGLKFNRAAIFLADNDRDSLYGRLGVGQLLGQEAHREWERLVEAGHTGAKQRCDLEDFFAHLHTRQDTDYTPIERQASSWNVSIAGAILRRIRETGKPEVVPPEQASDLLPYLPEAYCAGLKASSSAACVVMPLSANGRFLGMVLADNAFTNEPVRPEVLATLTEIARYAADLWERQDTRRRELSPAQREQLAGLRAQALQTIQDQHLQTGLQCICKKARELLQVDSVVIYPLEGDGVTYLSKKVAQSGLDSDKAKKTFAIRPRQHGMFAYVKRVGKLVIPDVSQTDLCFSDPQGVNQPLQQHGFIRDHEIQAFMGMALRSRNTGDPLGVMYLNFKKPHRFTAQEETLAEELADIAGLGISAARKDDESVQSHRAQELNRLLLVLEAALSPDADDTKSVSALLANAMMLLPTANRVELMVLEGVEGQYTEDGNWRVFHSQRGEPLVEEKQSISDSKVAEQAFLDGLLASKPCEQPGDLSALAAPIHHSKRVVGVLQVTSHEVADFDERDRARISELASAAGLVIGSLRHRQGLLGAVLKAAEEVTRPSSLQETLQAVVDQSHRAAPDLDCVTLWYRQPDSGKLVTGPFWGVKDADFHEGEISESELVQSIMQENEAVWAEDVQHHRLFERHSEEHSFIKKEGIVSTAVLLLRDEDVSVGALFFNYRKSHIFRYEEKNAFPIFAAIAAASIRDAQLIEAAKRGQKRLLAALEVAKAAGAFWRREQVLPAILTALRDHFGQYVANASPYLLLYNADDRVLELPEEAREFYPAQQGNANSTRLPLEAPRIACKAARRCLNEKRGVVVNIPDVTREENYKAPDSTTRSELCAGLWRDGDLLGVLVLKSQELNAFTEEDRRLFELVSEQVAAALERANQVAEKRVNDYLTGAMAWASDLAHDINIDIGFIRDNAYRIWTREPKITEQGKRWAKEIDAKASELKDKARDKDSERISVSTDLSDFLKKKLDEWQVRACPNTEISSDWGETAMMASIYPEQLWRALRHLLRNALHAMEYRGQIWLRLRPGDPDRVELQVENSGPDIPPEVRQRLFREPYSTKAQGGGMGLLIAEMLIKSMGGTLRLEPSQPGRGPVFTISLPRAKDAQEGCDDAA